MRFAVKKLNPGKQRKTVALVKGKPSRSSLESAYTTTTKAIEILSENDRSFESCIFEVYRRTVMIKPNLACADRQLGPANMVNTNPEACRAVVDWLIENEAKRIVFVESYDEERSDPWAACGYRQIFSEEPYADVVEFASIQATTDRDLLEEEYEMPKDFYTSQDIAFLKGFLEGREAKGEVDSKIDVDEAVSTSAKFSRLLREASVLINMPKIKTHVLTGVSLSVKNLFTFLQPPETRYSKHLGVDPLRRDHTYTELILSSLNLQRSVACVAAAFRNLRIPQLCIAEGIICQEGNGPLHHGSPREEHIVAASWNNPATLDTVLAEGFMGLRLDGSPYLPPHIQWASRLGLGTRDPSEICLVLAREDGIPASGVEEMRNNPNEAFEPPTTLVNRCTPRVFPRDNLLPVMTRALDDLNASKVDPNSNFTVVKEKLSSDVEWGSC